ncbi:glycoside hydrolase family 25 protein [Tenacibaculum sp. UWU-22]|uniref:glycoside hydrolase family 25 protein n=1 Tax=Tenacibaculum sp. UWU-22 TaxID=3234187 RepID=UPI0034DB5C1C
MNRLLAQHNDIIQKISKQNRSFEIQTILEETFFTSAKNCALIIQNINRYAVLFCEDTTYNEVERHNAFTSSFWRLVALIKYLKDNEYIYSLGGTLTNEKLCAIHPDFHYPRIQGDRIILNDRGWYSMHPDSIFDKNGALVLKGVVYKDSYYESALQNLTGAYILSEKFNDLLAENKEKLTNSNIGNSKNEKNTSKVSDYITIIHFLLTSLLFIIHLWLNRQAQNYIEKRDTYISSTVEKPKNETINTDTNEVHYGIDLSHYQGSLLDKDFPDYISFVICKATEGIGFTDPDFSTNWKYLKQKKIARGAYHFYIVDDNPIRQANYFLQALKENNYLSDDILPVVDIEKLSLPEDSNIDKEILNKNLLIFLNHIENEISKKPIIYTNTSFANKYLIDKKISDYSLWVADYTKLKQPNLPILWKDKGYKIWQKTNRYHIKSKRIDLDEYHGSLKSLKQLPN